MGRNDKFGKGLPVLTQRTAVMHFRVSKHERAAFQRLARERRRTLSDLVRQLLYAELGAGKPHSNL